MEENLEIPCYYAIIPANVRYDDKLKPNEKLLYGEITALSNKNGFCYATNKYFAKLYNVESVTISRWITHLKELQYIDIEILYKNNTKEIDKRIIKICNTPIDEKINTSILKNQEGIDEKVKENNTSINKRNNITNVILQRKEIMNSIISHLNEVTNSKFKTSASLTQTKINARLNEGYVLDDFIVVIDKKAKEWLGTEFERYLCPETLFGTKFEKYLNQKGDSTLKNSKVLREGPRPEWLGKDIKKEEISKEELAEMEALLQEFRE